MRQITFLNRSEPIKTYSQSYQIEFTDGYIKTTTLSSHNKKPMHQNVLTLQHFNVYCGHEE